MFNKFNLSIAGAIATIAFSNAAQAQRIIVAPRDLNPGDQYRLVFLTDERTDATSTNIADYLAWGPTMLNARQGKLLNWSTCDKMNEAF